MIETQYLHSGWKFRRAGAETWLAARIPGCVHTDLLAAGQIEDPFYRANEEELQWIDKYDWEYETEFLLDNGIISKEQVELVCDGLDTYGDVYLNETLVCSGDNMFVQWRNECKALLLPGVNRLRIYFHSPIKIDLPKLEQLGYVLPAPNDRADTGGLGEKRISVFARKAPYHYGWDWGPRFVTSGIFRPVYLEAWDRRRIGEIRMEQGAISSQTALVTAYVNIRGAESSGAQSPLELKGEVSHKGTYVTSARVAISPGSGPARLLFSIDNPRLWWTNGLGEPSLYDIRFSLTSSGEALPEDETTLAWGIRTLELVRDKDEKGESFFFRLNGRPLFIKGANHIPNDSFPSRVTPDVYDREIRAALEANLNMLRVWGGGYYEDDYFYTLCDKQGLLVWQDFMFACSMYPGDEAFLKNVEKEALYTIKRLRNHPCLALWCGNNEMDVAWSEYNDFAGWGWKQGYDKKTRQKIWADYEKIFHLLLPGLVEKLDPQTAYWPSSPLAGEKRHSGFETHAGDIHYWGVWHGKEPFENFNTNVGRFMSEYGFQSFPDPAALRRFSLPEDYALESTVMKTHQKSSVGNQAIREYMELYYKIPSAFEEFVYVSQLLQADGIKTAITAHRKNMPYCMGSIYWQLNDCWPAASWSSLDYYGSWKALHYAVKKAFNPVLIAPFEENNRLNIYIISDLLEERLCQLEVTLIDFEKGVVREKTKTIELSPGMCRLYYDIPGDELPSGLSRTYRMLKTVVRHNNEILGENEYYFEKPRDLRLKTPVINLKLTPGETDTRITLYSQELVKNLFISSVSGELHGSDNFFDLLPGEEKTITCTPPGLSPGDVRLMSLNTIRV